MATAALSSVPRSRTPVHLWFVAGAGLLWNAFGCFDYTMTQVDPAGYLASAGMSADAIAYMAATPAWLTGFWAVGVWGSLVGSLLLLARSRYAVVAFGMSLIGLAVTQIRQWLSPAPAEMTTPAMWVMTAVIWTALLLQLLYAVVQARRGVLR